MARRGERAKNDVADQSAPAKKPDRKALAKQEAERRAGAAQKELVKPPANESGVRAVLQEATQAEIAQQSGEKSLATPQETAGQADVAAPSPTIAQTIDEERERAITAAFEKAKALFDAARQSGEGFRLKGMIATSIGTLRKRHGEEGVNALMQRLNQAGVKDSPLTMKGGAEEPENGGEITREDIGSLENGLKEGEVASGIDLRFDTEEGKWIIVEKKTDAQGNESAHYAAAAYQNIIDDIQLDFGQDYLEQGAHRQFFLDLLVKLKEDLAAARVELITDPGGKNKISTAILGQEWSEEIGKAKAVSAQRQAKQKLLKQVIERFAREEIGANIQKAVTKEANSYRAKARSADWNNLRTSYGESTITLSGSVKIGERTVEMGDNHEYSIESLARLAGVQVENLSGDNIIAYARGKTLADLALRDPALAELIKTLPEKSPVTSSTSNIRSTSGGTRIIEPIRGKGVGSTNPLDRSMRDQDSGQTRGRADRGPGEIRQEAYHVPVRGNIRVDKGGAIPDTERLVLMQQAVLALNAQIAELDKEKIGVAKGSEQMADIAARQTPLVLERQAILQQIQLLIHNKQDKPAPAERPASEPSAKKVAPPVLQDRTATFPTEPEGVSQAPEPIPMPAPIQPQTEKKPLGDKEFAELQTELAKINNDLAARRKKLNDLLAREGAKGTQKKIKENSQITYERGQVTRLEQRRDALLAQLKPAEKPSEPPLTDQEREALIEQAHRNLPVFIRQGLRIITESVAQARTIVGQLQAQKQEKIGAARMEAIDNAIEIVNAAEKEHAEIIKALNQKQNIRQLDSLRGRSAEMARQSALALQRLEAFAKEIQQGVPTTEDSTEEGGGAAQKLREFYQAHPAGTHESGLEFRFLKGGDVRVIYAVESEGPDTFNTFKSHIIPLDTLKTLLSNNNLFSQWKKSPEDRSVRAQVLSAAADYFIGNMASGGFEKPIADEADDAPAASVGAEPGAIVEQTQHHAPYANSIEAHPNRLIVHYSYGDNKGMRTHSSLTMTRAEIEAALPEDIKTSIGDTPFHNLDEKSVKAMEAALQPFIQAKIAEKIRAVLDAPIGGETGKHAIDQVPAGIFDDRENLGLTTEFHEPSALERAEQEQGFNIHSSSSTDEGGLRIGFSFIAKETGGRTYGEYTISPEDIARQLPEDLKNRFQTDSEMETDDYWDPRGDVASKIAAQRFLDRIESGITPGLIGDAQRPPLKEKLDEINRLGGKYNDLIREARRDIQDTRSLLLHPASEAHLTDLENQLNENENDVTYLISASKPRAESAEYDMLSKIDSLDVNQRMIGWKMEEVGEIFIKIKKMKRAEVEVKSLSQKPPATGAMPRYESGQIIERGTVHERLTGAAERLSTPAPQLVDREPLQIGTGSEPSPLERLQDMQTQLTRLQYDIESDRITIAALDERDRELQAMLAELDKQEQEGKK